MELKLNSLWYYNPWLIVILEDKMYIQTYYKHQLGNVQIHETLAKVKVQKL
jgi:hypothetical protein